MSEGFAGASTAEIARRARTSKRAIYEHFPNKEKLFESIMGHLCALGAQESSDAPAPDGNLEALLRAAAQAVLVRFTNPKTRGVFIAAVAASPQFPSTVNTFWEFGPGVAAKEITAALKDAKAAGEISVARPAEAAERFIMECAGPVVLAGLFNPDHAPSKAYLERHIDQTVKTFMESIAP